MSLLDSISEMVLNFLAKIGLYHKDDSPAASFDQKPRPDEEEPYAEYTHVPLNVRKTIYEEKLLREYNPECDLIINELIKNKDHIENIIFSNFTITFKFENKTVLSFWIANIWHAFMSDIEIISGDGKRKKEFERNQPSKEVIVKFLNAFYQEIRYEKDKIYPPLKIVEGWIKEAYFTFNEEKKETEDSTSEKTEE